LPSSLAGLIKISNFMNFENPQTSSEKPLLTPELIELAKQGIRNANKVEASLYNIAQSLQAAGLADVKSVVYTQIRTAIDELDVHKRALLKHLAGEQIKKEA